MSDEDITPRPLRRDDYWVSLKEFLGDDDTDVDEDEQWIVRAVIPSGVPSFIIGAPKSGKTMIAEHLGLSVAAGLDWLGEFKTRQGKVLILPREDSANETRRRVWRLARGLGQDPRELDGRFSVCSDRPFLFRRCD